MIKRGKVFNRIIGLLIITFIIINFIPTPYSIMSPGIAQELSALITVEDGYKGLSKGSLMLTAVTSERATIWDLFYIAIRKPTGVELEDINSQLPPGMNMQQYLEIMKKYMADSQLKAQAVAFKKAGYQIELEEMGARIDRVMENSKALGKLQEGDLIISIDGQPVKNDKDAVDLIRSHQIGEMVEVGVLRDDKELSYNLKTIETEDNQDEASIGITIMSEFEYHFPREVNFQTRNIAGPSAGSMFALEIYNQLLPEDITGGRRIAGTGTIALDGSIGRIDGVEQKIIAAEKNGAEIFLVPVDNYEDARKAVEKITLVPTADIDQAIGFLKGEYNPGEFKPEEAEVEIEIKTE